MDFLNQLKNASLREQHLDWANLSYYWEDNEKLIETLGEKDKVIFMGDSITEEWGRLKPEFFQSPIFINRGIGGQTTPQMLLRFKQDVINLKPYAVFILAGTNDIAGNTGPSNIDMIINNIFSMAELSISYNIKTVLSSILPADKYPWADHIKNVPETILTINQELKSFSEKNNITYIDYHSLMVSKNLGLKKEYTTDGVHLNKMGYEVMCHLVRGILKKEGLAG
ncbi:MAG: acylhydrolase [Candidatus Marinimicrobia bacterium]|nr:acylhydrolase [Candidatus Neomarinimicrobiota bacterium]|tara:strand:- start:234 stop:908 length:675 start_codon:yes stop_codon:yes gene_type:complete